MKFLGFPSPHCHIQSLDTASVPENFAKREIELGTGTLTTTDHGSMGACRKVYDVARKNKLTPILGLEYYYRDHNCEILKELGVDAEEYFKYGSKDLKYNHGTVHFLDQQAYEAGVKILSQASLHNTERHGQESKPLFGWEQLQALGQQNVTLTGGCLIGMVARHLMAHKRVDVAEKYYTKLRSLVKPGNFYVEIFPHVCDRNWDDAIVVYYTDGSEERFKPHKQLKSEHWKYKAEELVRKFESNPGAIEGSILLEVMDNRKWVERPEKKTIKGVKHLQGFIVNECCPQWPDGDVQLFCNRVLIALARKYNDPMIISDDAHFAVPKEKIAQDVRLMAGGGPWRFHTSYHRMSSDEAFEYFHHKLGFSEKNFEALVDNNRAWAEKFKDFKFVDTVSLPTKFYPQNTLDHLITLIKKNKRMRWDNQAYLARLKAEINLLHRNGKIDLLPYFFLGNEVSDFYRQRGYLLSPGRGSAAGMLLTYLLRITQVDPLQYDLSMDRFLTPDRIQQGKLPDIDSDFFNREILIDHESGFLAKRFPDHFVQVSVDTTLKLRSSVRDVARVKYGKIPSEIEALAKKFKNAPQGITDSKFIFGYKKDDGTPVAGTLSPVTAEGATNPEYDAALAEYIQKYPDDWETVKLCLGLPRQKGRHACLPAGERVFVINHNKLDLMGIEQCNGVTVITGQGRQAKAKLINSGVREVMEYQLENGQTIRATKDHKVLTTEGWMTLDQAFQKQAECVMGDQQFAPTIVIPMKLC